MCTLAEMRGDVEGATNGCAAGTGCGHDSDHIWTGDLCQEPGTVQGFVVTLSGGQPTDEVSWTLVDSSGTPVLEGGTGSVSTCGAANATSTSGAVCTDTAWDFHLVDAVGDDWNGNTLTEEC